MSATHRVYLFDFDGTVFDTAALKVEIAQKLKEYTDNPELLWETERKLRGRKNYLVETLRVFSEQIGLQNTPFRIQDILLYHNFTNFVFPDTVQALKRLGTESILALFSEGDEIYQQFKAHQSQLIQYFDYTYIFPKKMDHLAEIVDFFEERKIWYIDNQLYHLEHAKKQFPSLTTVWINRDAIVSNIEFRPDLNIASLAEL